MHTARPSYILAYGIAALIAATSTTLAVDNNWTGLTSSDWNTDSNWSDPHGFGSLHVPTNGPGHPGDEDAVINTSGPNIATISANIPQMRDIKVGIGAGQVGIVNHTAGTAGTGAGNWLFIGRDGGNGTYNQSGGQLTGNGERTLIGSSPGSTGTYNISAGTLAAVDQLRIGDEGGTGKVVQTGGAVTAAQRLRIGTAGAGSLGTYQQSAGTVAVGDLGGNTHYVIVGGEGGGTGRYDIAGGAGAGTFTGLAAGSGSVNADRFYVGGFEDAAGGNGTVNINTSGTVAMSNDLMVGRGGGTGVVNLDAGTVTTGGWNFIGQGDNAPGGNGTVRISGGLLNNGGGRTYLGYNNSQGHLVMTGGEYRNIGDWTAVGHNNLANASDSTVSLTGGLLNVNLLTVGGSPEAAGKGSLSLAGNGQVTAGELWVGNRVGSVGSMTVSAGTLSAGSWLAVGRDGSTGTLTINGGAVSQGVADGGNPVLELTNFGNGGSATVNLNGGSLSVNGVVDNGDDGDSSSTTTFNFNGGILRARKDNGTFMQGLNSAVVQPGGAIIDTEGFAITIGQNLTDGGGGLTKQDAGVLTLSGTSTYLGTTEIDAGSLLLTGGLSGTSAVNVDGGATLGGTGTINSAATVSIASGGILSPGITTGVLSTGSVSLTSGSDFVLQLNGSTIGTDYDNLNVTGGVSLGSADLFVTLGNGFAPTPGQTFTVLSNDAADSILGMFASVNGGAFGVGNTFSLTNDQGTFPVVLHYDGEGAAPAGGNDVVLEVVPEPGVVVSLLGGVGMLLGLRRRKL